MLLHIQASVINNQNCSLGLIIK